VDLVSLLRSLVSFDTTVNPEIGKYPDMRIINFARDILEGLGMKVIELGSSGFRNILSMTGSREPRILLMAHLDTVPFIRSEWRHDPLRLEIEGDLAYGRGSIDDKGNVAAIMSALDELVHLEGCTVIVALTTDEEIGGFNGAAAIRDYLLSNGFRPSYVINGDGSSMWIINRRRGVFNVRITVKAKRTRITGMRSKLRFNLDYKVKPPYHAAHFVPGVDSHPLLALSQYLRINDAYLISVSGPFLKSNVTLAWVEGEVVIPCDDCEVQEVDLGLTGLIRALLPLSRLVLRTKAPSVFGITATPNFYRPGDTHEVILDVRAMSDDESDVARAVEEVLSEELEEYSVKVEGGGGYLYTPKRARLVTTAAQVLSELGVDVNIAEAAGASDSRYFSSIGIESIDFGPIGGNIHGPDEYVSLRSLGLTREFYVRLVSRLCHG